VLLPRTARTQQPTSPLSSPHTIEHQGELRTNIEHHTVSTAAANAPATSRPMPFNAFQLCEKPINVKCTVQVLPCPSPPRPRVQNARCSQYVYDEPNTFCVSSSLPSRPRFRIWPAFGAASRGVAASALRRASWSVFTRAACVFVSKMGSITKSNSTENLTYLLLVVQALVVVLQEGCALLLAGLVLAG
jgi:hypothetical protein